MSASREKDQADFDLDRFIDMFDEAMTSEDPRVVETLRKLLMIVALTRPETGSVGHDRQRGPLRRMFDDMHNLNKRLGHMEEDMHSIKRAWTNSESHKWHDPNKYPYEKYTMTAAAQMAKEIDSDIIRQMTMKINSGTLGGAYGSPVNKEFKK